MSKRVLRGRGRMRYAYGAMGGGDEPWAGLCEEEMCRGWGRGRRPWEEKMGLGPWEEEMGIKGARGRRRWAYGAVGGGDGLMGVMGGGDEHRGGGVQV